MRLALLALPLAAQAPYRVAAPAPPPVSQPYQPSYFVSAGGGDQLPGRGAAFAYWSASRFVGQQNWATLITEYSISANQVVTCPLAGLSHVVSSFGPVSLGLVGAGGACSGDKGGATGAASGQGFMDVHIAGAWSIIATARKTFTPNGSNAVRLTLGIGWGK